MMAPASLKGQSTLGYFIKSRMKRELKELIDLKMKNNIAVIKRSLVLFGWDSHTRTNAGLYLLM